MIHKRVDYGSASKDKENIRSPKAQEFEPMILHALFSGIYLFYLNSTICLASESRSFMEA
ncbi:MAG: hypothetical protein HC880_16950 [Bacteroidia bacterium]|nr:hypothetical protein [Bacteroidia bacterium]